MIKVTNNTWRQVELTDKMLKIISIVYSNDLYVMQGGEYKDAETEVAQQWLALWDIFSGKLTPIKWLQILPELLSQWQEWKQGNIILDKLFWNYE